MCMTLGGTERTHRGSTRKALGGGRRRVYPVAVAVAGVAVAVTVAVRRAAAVGAAAAARCGGLGGAVAAAVAAGGGGGGGLDGAHSWRRCGAFHGREVDQSIPTNSRNDRAAEEIPRSALLGSPPMADGRRCTPARCTDLIATPHLAGWERRRARAQRALRAPPAREAQAAQHTHSAAGLRHATGATQARPPSQPILTASSLLL
jgi:hypothetical protein